MNIAVVYNLPTKRAAGTTYMESEDDTAESAHEVEKALLSQGHRVTLVPVSEDAIASTIENIRADCIFDVIEWTGPDLPLSDQALTAIEKTGIPFTGASRANFMETSDKRTMKKAFDRLHLPTARWQEFTTGEEIVRDDFQYPVIIKPPLEHSSVGLTHDSIVTSKDQLGGRVKEHIKKFREPMIAEEFLDGREFQVTVVMKDGKPWVLPPAEVVYKTYGTDALLTYESRWDEKAPDYQSSDMALATLSPELKSTLEGIATRTFVELSFRDYMRLDVRMRGNDVYILEANSNPGLSDDIEYGMTLSYRAVGLTFADMIALIVTSAMQRAGSTPQA